MCSDCGEGGFSLLAQLWAAGQHVESMSRACVSQSRKSDRDREHAFRGLAGAASWLGKMRGGGADSSKTGSGSLTSNIEVELWSRSMMGYCWHKTEVCRSGSVSREWQQIYTIRTLCVLPLSAYYREEFDFSGGGHGSH